MLYWFKCVLVGAGIIAFVVALFFLVITVPIILYVVISAIVVLVCLILGNEILENR
jgi:hypothetical protein